MRIGTIAFSYLVPHSPELALFRDPQRAGRDLDQLRARVPGHLVSVVSALLGECADPDQALSLLERLIVSCEDLVPLFDKNRVLLHYVLAVFGQSYWLGETIVNDPALVQNLAHEKHLERAFSHEDFRRNIDRLPVRSSDAEISTLLASFRKRELIRIALRDTLGIATLAETTTELSALADVILENALQSALLKIDGRFGPASARAQSGESPFAVLALGKLGGNELNYSSDLDLLYLFNDDEGGTAREYFTRLAQALTEILCRTTPEGAVFRIDLRLRPQGGQGELASGVRQALAYYTHTADDWELQALIKLRYSAGDQALAREFITGVQPRVYSANLNFAAIDTALRSRERITARRRLRGLDAAHGAALDVKLDRGGIRDIEFLVQCLQRVYGGEESWLRSGGTLFSLQKLHDKGHIRGNDFHQLTQAYEFLRRVEHRLQLQRGRQLHSLPADPGELSVLQRGIGSAGARESVELLKITRAYMENVAEIYDRIIFSQRRREKQADQGLRIPSASSVRELSFEQVLERIAQDSPEIEEIARRSYSIHTRRNLHRFLSSALTGADRYADLLKNPQSVEKAMVLFASSDYLTDILARHPNAIRVLDDLGVEEGVPLTSASTDSASVHGALSLDELRRSFRRRSFSIAARDVLVPRPAFDSMRESSALADAAIRQALAIAGGDETLAVFALGRLGTCEFDIASDADLIFIRAADTNPETARVAAEKLVHALAAYTREGSLFAVDARLRPHGKEGELVVTPEQFERYLSVEAQAWEALSYTKLRFVAGRKDLADGLLPRVRDLIVEVARRPAFPKAVAEMRARLEKSNRYPHSFKLARGGFYDIDFIASFLLLCTSSTLPGNTLERLEHLLRIGTLEASTFEELRETTVLYRTADHVIRLVTGRARPELPAAEHARNAVEKLVHTDLGWNGKKNLQQELDTAAERVRALFQNTVQERP